MSGHSKWSKIKRQKEVGDHRRSQLFTKLARTITVAAKQGGGDPDMNFQLRLAINKAREANLPKDNIERAIQRGTGGASVEQYEEMVYEGFGPENIALIIEVLTDNRNRAVSELKHLLNKRGGTLASQNSVRWQFDRRGLIVCQLKKITEEQEATIIDSGALDYSLTDENLEIITLAEDLEKTKTSLEEKNFPIKSSGLVYLPKEKQPVKNLEAWRLFLEELDELEDINDFYTNAED